MAIETGDRPVVAVAGCVAQQEGESILRRSQRRRRDRRHAEHQAAADARRRRRHRGTAGSAPRDRHRSRSRTCRFRWASRGGTIPSRRYVTIIEGCNEFCAFCVVPYTRGHERMRPVADILDRCAPRGRRPARGKSSCSGRSSITTRRPTIRRATSRRCWSGSTRSPGSQRIRFASPHPRHVTPRMIDAMRDLPKVCRHLHLPVQSGSTRVLAAMRRRHTREQYLELVDAAARGHAGHRALDRYDRRLPRRDRRGLRGDAVARRRRCGITACSRSSTRRGRTRSR